MTQRSRILAVWRRSSTASRCSARGAPWRWAGRSVLALTRYGGLALAGSLLLFGGQAQAVPPLPGPIEQAAVAAGRPGAESDGQRSLAAASRALAYVEEDGQVVIEAERFDKAVKRGKQVWKQVAKPSGYAAKGAMLAGPSDRDFHASSDYATSSSELRYRIHFSTPGRYQVWVRAAAPSAASDSLHVGLDDEAPASGAELTVPPGGWTWSKTTADDEPATLDVAEAGFHTLNVWMAEDGLTLDRLLLTRSSGYVPSGSGPDASPRLQDSAILAPTATPRPATATPTATPLPATATPTATPGTPLPGAPSAAVRLSMFYHPPSDGTSVQDLAQRFGSMVFTKGDEHYREQLRAASFDGPILQYVMANEASGPAGLRSSADACGSYPSYVNNVSGIAGDFCAALHGDERNFLHNGRGERLYKQHDWGYGSVRTLYLMNPAAPGWRAYFAQKASDLLETLRYSGLYLDNVDLSLYRARKQELNSDGVVAEFSTNTAYREAVAGFLAQARGRLGSAPIWANMTSVNDTANDFDPYLPYLDGVLNEYFVARWFGEFADPTVWEVQLQQAEKALGQGKAFTAVGQGSRTDLERMRFALASYLLVADGESYFRYTGDADLSYYEAWLYDDYEAQLGVPLGSRYKTGSQWRRDFACGYVLADPAAHGGRIVTDPNLPSCGL